MQLSNKILIGFFGLIFLYLTAAFTELKLKGTPNIIDESNSIAETVELPAIACLVLQDMDMDTEVNVAASGRPRLEVRSISGDALQTVKYRISGDTLTLLDFHPQVRKAIKISVFVPKSSLKQMTVNASSAVVAGLDQSVLQISQNGGRTWMFDNEIGRIEIDASNSSYFDISASELDTLSARIKNSQVNVSMPITRLQGSMENSSYMRLIDTGEMNFSKDKSSRLALYH